MAQNLLAELHRHGIRLRLADGQLRVEAPAGTLTPELRDRLRVRRDELVGMLRRGSAEAAPALVTTDPDQRYEPFPLTDIQHAYWVGRGSAVELGGVSSHYYFELERSGLDPDRLTESLRRVIARHDMLRMVISADGRQHVLADPPDYQLPVVDLRGLAADRRDAELTRIRSEMDHQVLPADRWPLWDIRVSLLEDGVTRLHIGLDILLLDGLSLYQLFGEWRRFYQEPQWQPEPLSLTFRDYVLHEQRQRDGERYAADQAYWLERLDALPPAPALPLARQPAQLERTRFTRRQQRLPAARWAALKRQAQQRGLTPSGLLMAVYGEVLSYWSGQSACTLNLTLFHRPAVHPEINEVIGDFTSVVLLAVDAGREEPFAVRAGQLQRQLLRDLNHASYSGVRLLRERARRLGAGPGAAMPVVFTSALVLGAAGEDPSEGMRFFGEEVYGITQTPQVWLDHQVAEVDGDLVYNWDAVEELFPAGVLDDMRDAYGQALDRLCDDQTAWELPGPLAELPVWQASERHQTNHTAAPIPARTLGELVEAQARLRPDATAVIAADGELTYQETVELARRLAHRLRSLGAAPGTLVGVTLPRGRSQVPAVLGVNLAGAAYLPIDPHWPPARRAQLLDQSGARVVVTTPELRDGGGWPAGVTLVTLDDPAVRQAQASPLDDGPAPTDLAYVIFTSGSTGQPKGVMIDHQGASNTIQDINARFRVGPGDRVLALSALSFDLSVYDIFGTLAAGATVVAPSPAGVHDPAHWTELVERHHVTVWSSVPALMQAWTDWLGPAAPRPQGGSATPPRPLQAPASKLRLAMLSGDWIPVSLPDAVRARNPQAQVVSLGGATEASIWSVAYPIGEVPSEWDRIPYGKPLANQTMYVYDGELRPCPVHTTGEIYIGGVGVAKGYWGDPERTAAQFIVHPVTGERLYRTGDLGRYLPGGDIEFLGRADFQVKLNGYRIELGEIAATLRRQPGVAEAVVGVDTNPATGRRQLVAHVVPERPTGPSPAAATPPSWALARDAGATELGSGLTELAAGLAEYGAVWRTLEELCPPLMARTLARLGLFRAPGNTATAAGAVDRCGLKPGYRELLDGWLSALAARGVVVPTGRPGEYRCEPGLDPAGLDQQVRAGLATLDCTGSSRILADYVASCAERQVELLRGEVSPLQLLVPDGDLRVTEALYATNPVSHLQNRIAARAVRAVVDSLSDQRPVRVLEVGAGTGATTAEVLAALPTDRVEYRFTDISTFFTDRARRRFREYPFIGYGLLDIDDDPATQGHAPGSADVIVAANVLHDARDLTATLRRLCGLLAPGGMLVAIEGTAPSLLQLVTVGFIEGLSQQRAETRTALLSVPQWRERAEAAGFARFGAIPDGAAAVDFHVQHALLAQAPSGGSPLDPARLRSSLEQLLPDYMVPRHLLLIDRLPLSANGKVDRSALPSPWAEVTAEARVAPNDDLEHRLFGIWRAALERDDFGVEDNFFELGGDSLHAVAILGRLRDELGLAHEPDEGLEMLFDHPTIASLAGMLRARKGA